MAERTLSEEIEDILVDCYGEEEEATAWEVAFQDGVQVPFDGSLLDVQIKVIAFRAGPRNEMQCQILRGEKKRWVGVEDLDEEKLPADFLHVLGLYKAWSEGRY
jgi:hypothetical protein